MFKGIGAFIGLAGVFLELLDPDPNSNFAGLGGGLLIIGAAIIVGGLLLEHFLKHWDKN